MITLHSPCKHLAAWLVASILSIALGPAFAAPATGDTETHSVTGASISTDGMQHDGKFPDGMMTQFIDELGLTGQQQTDIQIIVSDYGERIRDLMKIGRKTASELLALAPDDLAYREKTDEASAIAASSAAEMVVLLAEMRGKLHMVLTESQRQKLQQMIDEKRQKLKEKKREGESHHRRLNESIG